MVAARYPNDRIGLGGGAGNTGEGGDNGIGICGGDEDHGDSGDAVYILAVIRIMQVGGGGVDAVSSGLKWLQSPPADRRQCSCKATTTGVGRRERS
ncbi:hypothetical protein Tco_0423997 [Tanacetum coccineum]